MLLRDLLLCRKPVRVSFDGKLRKGSASFSFMLKNDDSCLMCLRDDGRMEVQEEIVY